MARTSLVLWAGLSLVAALVIAPIVRWIDHETGWGLLRYTPEGARAVLSALVGSMLTFIVFVLSTTLIVVQLASGQSTPRVIAMVLTTPGVKIALALLTFTFAYTLAALARIEDRVPDLHVSIAVLLNIVCIVVFFQFVHRLSTGLRPASLIQLVADQAKSVIDDVYPLPFDASRPEQPVGAKLPDKATHVVELTGRSGVVAAFSAPELVRLAMRANVIVQLIPQVGDFVAEGDPLFRVYGDMRPVSADDLRGCVVIGVERTVEQDPRFVFRILVDIASKALSPAINDPTTAVQALDQIQYLLGVVGKRHLDEGDVRDTAGKLRLVYGTPDWPDFVILAVSEVRQFGAGSLQVHRRLRAMLERLMEVLPEPRRPPLQKELTLLGRAIKREFDDEEDRIRASIADNQGVGGSET
jgi:uncharacterized membrane protein